jgi:hypothetical protein
MSPAGARACADAGTIQALAAVMHRIAISPPRSQTADDGTVRGSEAADSFGAHGADDHDPNQLASHTVHLLVQALAALRNLAADGEHRRVFVTTSLATDLCALIGTYVAHAHVSLQERVCLVY